MEVSLYFWHEKGIGIDMGSQTSLKTSQRGWGGEGGVATPSALPLDPPLI